MPGNLHWPYRPGSDDSPSSDAYHTEPPDWPTIRDTLLAELTVRERELLGMLSRGWSNQLISNRTGISKNTVNYHLKNLYDKLSVSNWAMAVALYSREKEGR